MHTFRVWLCAATFMAGCASSRATSGAAASTDPCADERAAVARVETTAGKLLYGDGSRQRNALGYCEMKTAKTAREEKANEVKASSADEMQKWTTSPEHRAKIISAHLCYLRGVREIQRRREAGETDGLAKPIGAPLSEAEFSAAEARYRHVLDLNQTPRVECDVDFIPELTTCELLMSWYLVRRPDLTAPCETPRARARSIQYTEGPQQLLDIEQSARDKRLDPKSLLAPPGR